MLPQAEREALIRDHVELARVLVHRILRRLPSYVSRDELIAVGTKGLVEAAARFDPARGVKFVTFAYYRIRGAVFDHIRDTVTNDPFIRSRVSAEAAVDDIIEGTLAGRMPRPGEGPAEAAEALASVLESTTQVFAVADCAEAMVGESSRTDTEEEITRRETASTLRKAVESLPAKERTMLLAVYFEGRTIEQAGASLGLSKSWASRLHARALAQLRDAVGQHLL